MSEQSTFWSEEHLVKISQSQVSEPEWMETVATSPSNFLNLLTGRGPDGFSGRTSPAYFPQLPTSLPIHVRRKSTWTVKTDPLTGKKSWSRTNTTQTKTMRSPVSWPDFQNSGTSMPTGLLTLNTSEYRNGATASSLSDILETGAVPQRYFLTGTACRGILRRAERRGKALPEALRLALLAVSGGGAELEGSATILTEVEPSCPSDAPGPYWDGSDIADTLDASNASKQQAMPEKRRFQAILTGPLMNSGKAAGSATQQDAETGMLVTAPVSCRPYADRGAEEYGMVSHSLRAEGFDASEDGTGRGTPLVPVAFRAAGQDGFTPSGICPPIACTDGGGAGVPTVMTMAIRGREGSPSLEVREDGISNAILTPNGGRAGVGAVAIGWSEELTAQEECAGTLSRGGQGGQGGRHDGVMTGMQVRRLTPTECARLQAVPDDHLNILYRGKPLADSPKYKLLGNGFCINVVRWIGKRLDAYQKSNC